MQIHELSQHNTKFWVLDDAYADFNIAWFEDRHSEVLINADKLDGGRQAVVRLSHAGLKMVQRHYYRGGVPARFSKDKFVFHGYQASRSYQELRLLVLMRELALPVPKPVAARCCRHGIFYSADILMHEIPHALTLAQTLAQTSLDEKLWLHIGEVIHRFHMNGIQHVDLNANNILLDQDENVFLIDFDRCCKKTYSKQWADQSLQRLHRSLQKEKSLNSQMHFEEDMFEMLKRGHAA